MRKRPVTIAERLTEVHAHLCRMAENQERDHNLLKQNHKLLKEVLQAMAVTQADIDALTQQVENTNQAVVAQGVQLVKIGEDIVALGNTPGLSVDALQAKIVELGGRVTDTGTKLQDVDNLVPERPGPTP